MIVLVIPLLIYLFGMLCGVFSWIFVSQTISIGILARNTIAGLAGMSLPLAMLIWPVCHHVIDPAHGAESLTVSLVITSVASHGFGAMFFEIPHAGSIIVSCVAGGLVYFFFGFIFVSVYLECHESEETDEVELPQTPTYRIVEHPCGQQIQIAQSV
jgi:hypothetical protein